MKFTHYEYQNIISHVCSFQIESIFLPTNKSRFESRSTFSWGSSRECPGKYKTWSVSFVFAFATHQATIIVSGYIILKFSSINKPEMA